LPFLQQNRSRKQYNKSRLKVRTANQVKKPDLRGVLRGRCSNASLKRFVNCAVQKNVIYALKMTIRWAIEGFNPPVHTASGDPRIAYRERISREPPEAKKLFQVGVIR
jgi:hypothetical protein